MLVNTQNWMGIVGHKAIEFLFVHKTQCVLHTLSEVYGMSTSP